MKPSATQSFRGRTLPAALASVMLCASLLPAPIAFAQTSPTSTKFRGGEPVTLNFVNAEIEGVARAMSAILKQQFIVDPRVKGTMTLYSDEPLSPREAYLNFLAALRGLGFTVVEVGGLFKVVPEADAKLQTGTVSVGDATSRRGDQVITQIFKLAHENANNLVPVLRPLISPNNTINANPGNNTLVITDYADNLQRIGKIIAAMDTPAAGDVEVIPLKYAVAADVAALVQRLTDSAGGTAGVPGVPPAGGAASVLVEPRSNSLLVRAANPVRMASIRALVAKLDQPTQGTGNVWVVYLKNADAVKLATVLRAAYSGGTGGASSASPAPTTSPVVAGAAGGASPQATAPVAPSASPSTGGFVQADPATNALIITAPEPMYKQLRVLIDQLDSRRAQVYIESMIVEVQGEDAANFGLQWQGLLGRNGDSNGIVAGTNFGTTGNLLTIDKAQAGGSTAAASLTLGEGLNIGWITKIAGTYGLAAIANILQSRANTNIVSTPNLITLDNEEAKIIVGSNVPFITGQFTNTGTATSSPFQTIERKDVGITLRIKPQIGEGGTVRMVIFQESSSLSTSVAPGTSNAGPSTNKRSIESTVVVDDGQILVLGGLIEDKYTDNRAKIPLLGDIPYLGALFRNDTRTKTRTNLMVFLRPIIMRDAATSNKVSLDRYDLIRAEQKESQPKATLVLPIGSAPVLPPLRRLEDSTTPLSVPPAERPASGVFAPAPAASAP
ncbi:MAG: type II secretion system secretin GspD [Burkholderiales bacterium]|nr:type II secretion system secretin GspD [Burkholderiales bacterium]